MASSRPAARQAALDLWRQLSDGSEPVHAEPLVARAMQKAGLSAQALPAGDPLLAGAYAVLDRELGIVWYDGSLSDTTRRFSLAHEIAHWYLHDSQGGCGEGEIDFEPCENPLPLGESYVQGYSPAQRRETEANVFAAELLAPAPTLRAAYQQGLSSVEIAETIGISETTVLIQLAEALLLNTPVEAASIESPAESSLELLDSSQRAAAEIEAGPTLVVAGPGTGKTRTLVARVEVLLQRGTPPQQILALTFSNRAANEMRDRLSLTSPNAARKVWIGTFHAFGLEVLRRFGARIGLPLKPRILDTLDAIALMVQNLGELGLEEYEFLHDPTLPMRDLLGAISRAKDELRSPRDYAEMAARMASNAEDEAARREARRAAEVAAVYGRWQSILEREGVLDFGDLQYRAVELLRTDPEVRQQLRGEFPEILVDEYQDINHASAVLVRELAGEGRGLWLVGDRRQAIYRFRGASPANVTSFEEDYPGGRRVSLEVNYRSRPALVGLFSSTARAIGQPSEEGWSAHRGDSAATVIFGEAEDEWAQADHIASYVESFQHQGHRYREQAILCRTNRQAGVLGALLEERGVPVVYLGELLARSEVKDLLAVLSLPSEGPHALRRVANIPEYAIPPEEVDHILERASSGGVLPALSVSAHPGARTLAAHISPLAFVGDAFSFLSRYLFHYSDYLRKLVRDDSVSSHQKRIAIYQLMEIARSFRSRSKTNEHPHRAFLSHIRRLLATGEESRAAIPTGIASLDGVRLMTVHASKGLEFPVVFIPNLSEGLFPPRSRGGMVRLPPGLADAAGSETVEEARLFFVALSRARDHLVLSFPRTIRGRPYRPSSLLPLVRKPLATMGAGIENWRGSRPEIHDPEGIAKPPELERLEQPLSLSEVDTYLRCPRQFFYRYRQRLEEPDHERGYRVFSDAVRRLIRWYQEERSEGRTPTDESTHLRLEEIWNGCGLSDLPHSGLFRRRLETIRAQLDLLDSHRAEEWTANLENGAILLTPDGLSEIDDTLTVERHHVGRESDSHRTSPVLSLYRVAAQQRGAKSVTVVNRYLSTGEAVESPANGRYEPGRLQKYEKALEGIRGERFEASPPDPNECNRCPFFLVCPH